MKNKILSGVILVNLAVVAAIGQQYQYDPNNIYSHWPIEPNRADFNYDGRVDFVDFAYFCNCWKLHGNPGFVFSVDPDETALLRMEVALKDKMIAALQAELESRRLEDTKHIEHYIWQLATEEQQRIQQMSNKWQSTMIGIGEDLLRINNPVTLNWYDGKRTKITLENGGTSVTFDFDPNGVK